MIKSLRPYQADALASIKKCLKESADPVLVDSSVGSGKSLILSELLLSVERAGYRGLCLTMNSTLIDQNNATYQRQGGNSGIYCSGLKELNTTAPIIFASPHSIAIGLKAHKPIERVPFNIIIVDECHNIDHTKNDSMYMRILNFYGFQAQQDQRKFRIVGLSGTCYRGNGVSICGENEFFKTKACSISASYLIEQGYLTKPNFDYNSEESIDFSKLKTNKFGKFNNNELQEVVDQNERLTGEIMRKLIKIIEGGRKLVFIFASTIKHCEECLRSLPPNESACITGKTPHEERKRILNDARSGKIKYLVNVQTLLVGIDCTIADVACFVRPTESLVLFVQAIGRVLRLHEGKKDALIIDAAGNLDRFQSWDDPIINEAIKPRNPEDGEYVIKCYQCMTLNKVTTRRCIGTLNNKRCDYYFEFKACPSCAVQNDITSRVCRACDAELIDPNAKLTLNTERLTIDVIRAEYWLNIPGYGNQVFNSRYITKDKPVFESYVITERSKNIFYAKFIKQHTEKPSDWYPHIMNQEKMKEMIYQNPLKTPNQLIVQPDEYGRLKLISKIFYSE